MKKWVLGAIALVMVPLIGGLLYVLLITMTITTAAAGSGAGPVGDGQAAYPMDLPIKMTEDFGPRDCPVWNSNGSCAASTWHVGVDLIHGSPSCGDAVYAVLPGEVTLSSALTLSIKHPNGYVISYLHMYKSQRLVDVGDVVQAGQQIGVAGNVQPSSGCHLDMRVNVAANKDPAVAQLPIVSGAPGPWVDPEAFMALFGVELCPADSCPRLY
jgi:murein DD-endopeptidase MepM/ murein hydrolase activator NlpD